MEKLLKAHPSFHSSFSVYIYIEVNIMLHALNIKWRSTSNYKWSTLKLWMFINITSLLQLKSYAEKIPSLLIYVDINILIILDIFKFHLHIFFFNSTNFAKNKPFSFANLVIHHSTNHSLINSKTTSGTWQ